MENKIAKKLDNSLTKFNALSYKDKAFVRSVVIGELTHAEIAMKVYDINDEIEADVKSMTTLSRPEIQGALSELNNIQSLLMKSKILNMSDEALIKTQSIMRNGIEESNRLKAATTIVKMGVDLVKEADKKNEHKAMKIIIENPSGDIKINFGADKIMESFGNVETVEEVKEEIIEGEFEEVVDHEEKTTAVTNEVAVEEKVVDQKEDFHKDVNTMIKVMEKVVKKLEPKKEEKPKNKEEVEMDF